jgi:hypothetical protein
MKRNGLFKRQLIIYFVVAAVLVQILFLPGCGGNSERKKSNNTELAGSNSGILFDPAVDITGNNMTVLEVYHNPDSPIPDYEFDGVVYQGYIYRGLYENEWGWRLGAICNTLGIRMVMQDDEHGIYEKHNIPIDFYLEKGNIRLTFKADTDTIDEWYINNPHMATIQYRVYRDGREIPMNKTPITYRAGGPYMDLKELLYLLEIDYAEEPDNIYMDSSVPTQIKGKVLFDGIIDLDSQKVSCKLLYNYKGGDNPVNKDIKLVVGGEEKNTIILFDEETRGSTDYYYDGGINVIDFKGEQFVQVNLNRDTFIFKYTREGLVPIFSRSNYEDIFLGDIYIKRYEGEKSIYVDEINGFQKEFECRDIQPFSKYIISPLCFERVRHDVKNNRLGLVLRAGIVRKGKTIFSYDIDFNYKGNTFTPSEVVSTNWEKFNKDKENGKSINMADYLHFKYEWGKKLFMIAQSYMPAQDIHILKNMESPQTSPWYKLDFGEKLSTPEWRFYGSDLKRFR